MSHLSGSHKDSRTRISWRKQPSIATNSSNITKTRRSPPTTSRFFKKAVAATNGPAKILALAEAWCGDVYRELPTIARIAEATGADLRVFLRDENPDIMDEFLSNNGKSRAIPVFVFYTKDTRYIAHFLERSAGAHEELAAIIDEVSSTDESAPRHHLRERVPEASKQEFLRDVIAKIRPRFPDWQKESIKEMRALLASALNIPDRG